MISNWFKKLKFEDAHPAEETLLACVDGELSAKETESVRKHLENCWSCRARLDELQEAITLFVNFRNQVQNPLAAAPPNDWSNFDRRLAQLSAEYETEKASIPKRLGLWQKFRQSLDFAEWSPARRQFGIGTVTAVLIVALLWQMVGVRSVSAAEILENSIRSQKQNTERVNQPVVYRKLRLTHAGAKPVDWETWHDAGNSRYRQALADERDGGGRRFISAALNSEKTDSPDESVLREVARILQANRMNPQRPVSAESFRAWRDSLTEKSDEIENSPANDGAPVFTLKTVSNDAAENGKIIEAALTVRANDWHAGRLRFSVKNETGASVYEFVETAFEVVSLSALSPEIFPRGEQQVKMEIASASPDAEPSPAVSPSAESENNANADPILQPSPSASTASAPPTAASAELEVEVLRLLSGIGADIGEEATVTRSADGGLLVQGVVESRARKSEILASLSPFVGQPGLSVRIETSQEAQKRVERERTPAAKNKPSREDSEAVSVQPLEIRDTIPADAEVRRYLRAEGTAENLLTGEINRFATRALNRSNQILLRALALKSLANRFSETQLRSMKPEARNEWLNLIAARASEIKNQNAALRQELGAVFGGISTGGESVDASGEAGLKRAAVRLSEMATGNDRAVRAAFTFSSGANADAVKGAPFRQSLGSIEGLANSIQSAVRKLQGK